MKKLVTMSVFGAALIFGFNANAQTGQGGWLIGGSSAISYSSTDNGFSTSSVFLMDMKAGYFVAENLNLGLSFGYLDFDGSTLTTIGPFARYYINGGFFLGAGYESQSSGGENASLLNLEGGYPIFINDNVAIEPGITYAIGLGDYDGLSTFAFGVGFTFYF